MDDLESDARLFCYGIGSRYFADIYDAFRKELDEAGYAQQVEILDMLVARLRQMRDLLEQELKPATREASTIRGESIDITEPDNDGGAEEKYVSG